jgi:imidazolonepropionase
LNLFIRNISQLVTVAAQGQAAKRGHEMRELGVLRDAAVVVRDGKISWVGSMADWNPSRSENLTEFDATGSVVLPGFVDSHTHMLFAGNRVDEFALRTEGLTYQEIAARGGGILNTIRHVRAAPKRELKRSARRYLTGMLSHGTTTVEIKSGYGLDVDTEIKMLEAINELKQEEMISIAPTFIGAHAIPPEYTADPNAYVDVVVNTMIPYVGKKSLAVFCDVFCEQGYFDVRQSERILKEGQRWGMSPKVHADELTALGGAELAAHVGAVSADHLEHISVQGISALRESGVVATVLPGVSFFLQHGYAPVRTMIDEGLPVAIASDFNPGSCMSFSMPMMMTIACTQMGMTPEEAITATTLNGAAALNMSDTVGSIEVGKNADLLVASVPDYRMLPYHFGLNHIQRTIKNGTILEF